MACGVSTLVAHRLRRMRRLAIFQPSTQSRTRWWRTTSFPSLIPSFVSVFLLLYCSTSHSFAAESVRKSRAKPGTYIPPQNRAPPLRMRLHLAATEEAGRTSVTPSLNPIHSGVVEPSPAPDRHPHTNNDQSLLPDSSSHGPAARQPPNRPPPLTPSPSRKCLRYSV